MLLIHCKYTVFVLVYLKIIKHIKIQTKIVYVLELNTEKTLPGTKEYRTPENS